MHKVKRFLTNSSLPCCVNSTCLNSLSNKSKTIFFSIALFAQIPKRPKTSQNILTASRNKMQLGKTKFQLELLLKNACTCVWKTTTKLTSNSSTPKALLKSFAVQITSEANEFFSKNIILIHQVDEIKHHASKTHSHAFSTNSRSSQTILHHFTRCAQINHHEHHVVATLSLIGQKRSTCNQYARECILPYPLLLRFPSIQIQLNSSEVTKDCTLHICIKDCCHLFNLKWGLAHEVASSPVADVLQKYLCTRINPVFRNPLTVSTFALM